MPGGVKPRDVHSGRCPLRPDGPQRPQCPLATPRAAWKLRLPGGAGHRPAGTPDFLQEGTMSRIQALTRTRDAGMSTAEYAIGVCGAGGFAGC